jgi:hypothetical protein
MTAATYARVGETLTPNGLPAPLRGGRLGDVIGSYLNGRFVEAAARGTVYHSYVASLAQLSAYPTTSGPLLWNPPGSPVNVSLLSVGFQCISPGTSTAIAFGLAFGQQATVPTGTTAITTQYNGSLYPGPRGSAICYNSAGLSTAPSVFLPFAFNHTAASDTLTFGTGLVELSGSFIIGPGAYVQIANVGNPNGNTLWNFIYSEVPI